MSTTSSLPMRDQAADGGRVPAGRDRFAAFGGLAALIAAAMYFFAGIVTGLNASANPVPGDVAGWLALFQANGLAGLIYLGLADIVIALVSIPLFLALYDALKPTDLAWSRLAVAVAFVGIACYLATNTAFSMLAISHRYAAASTVAQQTPILAAGQAVLVQVDGTGGRYLGLPLLWAGGWIASVVMLRSGTFHRVTAYAGILAFPLLLAGMPFASYTTTEALPAVEAVIVGVSYIGGGLLSLAWYVLVGRRLILLSRAQTKPLPGQA